MSSAGSPATCAYAGPPPACCRPRASSARSSATPTWPSWPSRSSATSLPSAPPTPSPRALTRPSRPRRRRSPPPTPEIIHSQDRRREVPRRTGHPLRRPRTYGLHEDRTPSLHVYAEPERGWMCFGCGRGGSIYDLAAALEGVTPRGAGFVALREWLEQRFGITPTREEPAMTSGRAPGRGAARQPVQDPAAPVAAAGLSSSPSVAPQSGAVRAASPVHRPTGGTSS